MDRMMGKGEINKDNYLTDCANAVVYVRETAEKLTAITAELDALKEAKDRATERAWRAESKLSEKWGLRHEISDALGVSHIPGEDGLREGLAAIKRLQSERDRCFKALQAQCDMRGGDGEFCWEHTPMVACSLSNCPLVKGGEG
jgi:hypothetical protein